MAEQDAPIVADPPKAVITPPPAPEPTAAELLKQLQDLGKKVDDQNTYIREVETRNATLETRLNHTQAPPHTGDGVSDVETEIAEALEQAQLDPKAAAKRLANVVGQQLSRAKTETMGESAVVQARTTYIAEVRAANKEIVDYGWEPALATNIAMRLNGAPPKDHAGFKKVVDEEVAKVRDTIAKIKTTGQPAVPPEAKGEGGGNPPPPPPKGEAPPETQADEIARRQKERQARGL